LEGRLDGFRHSPIHHFIVQTHDATLNYETAVHRFNRLPCHLIMGRWIGVSRGGGDGVSARHSRDIRHRISSMSLP
jgi:hypothetical protein